MANVLMKITIPFKWTIDPSGKSMEGSYILRNKGVVNEDFGTVTADFKSSGSAKGAFQWSNGFGFSKKCDKEEPKTKLLTT